MEQGSVFKIPSNKDKSIEAFSNIEAEIALIGCILWDNRNYEKVSDFLNENHFVEHSHQIIFKQIKELLNYSLMHLIRTK